MPPLPGSALFDLFRLWRSIPRLPGTVQNLGHIGTGGVGGSAVVTPSLHSDSRCCGDPRKRCRCRASRRARRDCALESVTSCSWKAVAPAGAGEGCGARETLKVSATSEGVFHRVALPKWQEIEQVSKAEVSHLEWLGGENFNFFTTMKWLRQSLWSYLIDGPKIEKMLVILFHVDGHATALECYYSTEGMIFALGGLSAELRQANAKYRGYVLCRRMPSSRDLSYSYCRKEARDFRQNDFVDRLDESGKSAALGPIRYGRTKVNFLNLFQPLTPQMSNFDYSQEPAER